MRRLARTGRVLLILATLGAAPAAADVVLPGTAAHRLDAAAGDTGEPNLIRTGKEILEWTVPAVPAGVYCVEMKTRTGNTDDDPLNIVTDYRLVAVNGDRTETAPLRFEPKAGAKPEKVSPQWPDYVGDITSTAPLALRQGMRLRVSVAAPWVTVREVRLVPAPARSRLSFSLNVLKRHSLFRRNELITVQLSAASFWDAQVKVPVDVELISPYGKVISQSRHDLNVSPMTSASVPLTFSTSLSGCHFVRVRAVYTPAGGAPLEYVQEVPVGIVAVPTADRLSPTSPFGVHPAGLSSLYQSGFKWVRLWDSGDVWAAHEREGKSKFDFTATEEKVENFRRAGFAVLAPLAYTPTWASTHPEIPYYTGHGSPFPPKNIADWKDYCREYMTRFKGRIRYYEVWNEPNTGSEKDLNDGFFRGSVDDYVALLKAAYEVSREVDPEIRIVGLSGTGDFLAWTEAVLERGGGKYMDILSFHAYTTPSSPEEANLEGRLTRLHQIMQKHGIGQMPCWNTEVGYWQDRRAGARPATADELLAKAPAGLSPNWIANWPYRPITEEDAAAFAVRHYYLNLAGGIERLFWYSSSRTGLPMLCEDDSLRLMAFAVASAANELEGYTYWRRIDFGLRRLHLHLFRAGDRVKGILWYADRGVRDVLFPSAADASAVDIWGNPVELVRSADGIRMPAGRDPVTICAPASFFDSARLQDRELLLSVDDAYVVRQVDAQRPVKDHTSPAYHGNRRVFGLPSIGDTLGWKLAGIAPGQYQVEVELRTGDADALYRDLSMYDVAIITGGKRTPVRLAAAEDPARRPQPIATKEGGNRAYGWARGEAPVHLEAGSEIHVALKQSFGFVGSLALREQQAEQKPIALTTLAEGGFDELRKQPPLEIRHHRQVAIGVADPFASTSDRDAWQGEKDLSAKVWAGVGGGVLHVAVDVTDAGGGFPAETGAYNGDAVELFLDLRTPPALGTPSVSDGVYHLMLRAPKDAVEGRLEGRVPPGAKATAVKTADGWRAEFLVPALGLAKGQQIGLDVAVDDDDTGRGRKSQIVLHGTRENFQDPSNYGRFIVP